MPTDKENSEIDLKKILLPKKEGPSPTNASRVNAGALLEQEQKAGSEGAPERRSATPQEATRSEGAALQTASSPAQDSVVKQLRTYKSAIEDFVQKKNVSVVSIAAAEATRRAQAGATQQTLPEGEPHELGLRVAAIAGGVFLIVAAVGLIAFIFTRPQASAPVQSASQTPLVSVDEVGLVAVPLEQWGRVALMQAMQSAREGTSLSLGLVKGFAIAQASSSDAWALVPAGTFLETLAPNVPSELARSLRGEYLFGIHAFDENQPFLIFDIESYEGAYAAMLLWEWRMQLELSPLFTRTPSPKVIEDMAPIVPLSTSTAAATSTPTSTSTPPAPVPPSQPRFVDRVLENHDARVLQNDAGDILLLWTFLDRQTLLITTNEYTLREVISRLKRPSTVPL